MSRLDGRILGLKWLVAHTLLLEISCSGSHHDVVQGTKMALDLNHFKIFWY